MFSGDAPRDEESPSPSYSMALRHVKLNFLHQRTPGKSGAEYQADYRQRLKADPEKWKSYLNKQREHSKRYMQQRSDEKKQAARERNKLRQRERRRAAKEAKAAKRQDREDTTDARQTRKASAIKQQSVSKKREYWREKQAARRASMTPEEKEARNRRSRELYALKKKTHFPSAISEQTQTDTIAFSDAHTDSPSKAAKYCAFQRTKKTFPKNRKSFLYVIKNMFRKSTPKKRKMIFSELNKEFSKEFSKLYTPPPPSKAKVTKKTKDSQTKQKIVSFYLDSAVDLPGKRQYSKRLKKQRKILTQPINNVYIDFISRYPQCKVSRRTFFRCRPRHVLTMKSMKFVKCLCETCENVRLMSKSLQSIGSQFLSVTQALEATMCSPHGDWWDIKCVTRTCDKCGIHILNQKLESHCNLTASVNYKSWDHVTDEKYKTKKTTLVNKSCTGQELVDLFCNALYYLSLHVFTYKWQRHQFLELKNNLPDDVCLIIMDFAENYSCHFQFEVQSAHWTLGQCTIHPVVIYSKCCDCKDKLLTTYRVYVSDDLVHDSNFVHHVLTDVLKTSMKSRFVIFSDNCSAQYKSKLPFFHMSQLAGTFDFERCFFGERHGKSECDSCGGMVKAYLSQAVVSSRVILRNAEEIYEFLSSTFQSENINCSHSARSFHLVNESSIDRTVQSSSLKTLPGTKKIHSFRVVNSEIMATRQFSCFCEHCMAGNYELCFNKALTKFDLIKWPNAMATAENADPLNTAFIHNSVCELVETVHPIDAEPVESLDDFETVESGNSFETVENGNSFETVENGNSFETVESVETVHANDNLDTGLQSFDAVIESVKTVHPNNNLDTGLVESFKNAETVVGNVKTVHPSNNLDTGLVIPTIQSETVLAELDFNVSDTAAVCKKDSCLPDQRECKKNVRRNLFCNYRITLPDDKDAFFNYMYTKILSCPDFVQLNETCRLFSEKCESFSINISDISISSIRACVDQNALKLMPLHKPSGYLPVLTVGDGNCMPRSLSTLSYGSEKYHKELRCRIICELICNTDFYLNEEFVNTDSIDGKENLLPLIACLSDCHSGEDTNDPRMIKEIFEKEVITARKMGVTLGLWQLWAAASVLKCVIMSVYPDKGCSKIRALFNRGLVPRNLNYDSPVYVMWTSNRSDMTDKHWVANHVVPLLKCHSK